MTTNVLKPLKPQPVQLAATAISTGKLWPYSTTRIDTATLAISSGTVTDAAITAADAGRPVSGQGIPAGSYVGTVTAGASFLLSSSASSQVAVTATANYTGPITIGGAALAPVLPALSGVTDDDCVIIEKDSADPSSFPVTVTAAGADAFATGATSIQLLSAGERLELQAATLNNVRVWKVIRHSVPRGALTAAFSRRVANTLAVWGDSLTNNGQSTSGSSVSWDVRGYWVQALAILGHRLRLDFMGGLAGDTTAQILARLQTFAASNEMPKYNWVLGGTNDGLNGVSYATAIANLQAIYDLIESKGGRIVALTTPPNTNATTAQRNVLNQINAWIRRQAFARTEFRVVDAYNLLADTTGAYRSGMSNDGTHPLAQGSYLIGNAVATAMTGWIPNLDVLPAPSDVANLIAAPHNTGTGGTLGTGGSGTAADGWNISTSATATFVGSIVARTDGVAGSWQQIAASANSGVLQAVKTNLNVGTDFQIGDQVYGVMEFQDDTDVVGGMTSGYFRLKAGARASGSVDVATGYDYTNTSGQTMALQQWIPRAGVLVSPTFVVPATTNKDLILALQINLMTGTFRIGRHALYKVGTGPMA